MSVKFIKTWSEIGISLLRSGENYFLCPDCSKDRKKSKTKCFCVNNEKQVGHCNHCDVTYLIAKDFTKEYKKPDWNNDTKLSDKVVKWFESRGIFQDTLLKMKITEGLEFMPQSGKNENCIKFNYFRNSELINIKYRDGAKRFKLFKDGELIFFNIDSIKDVDTCIITEGEIDCLSFIQAGINNVVSVPNGANKAKNNLQYIDNCFNYFENINKIYIAVDNDEAGINLRNDLATRLDAEKCFIVDFKDCKDANEYLQKYGVAELSVILENAKPVPVSGIIYVNDIKDEIYSLYKNGLQKGLTINIPEHDELISFEKGRLTIITGIPTHGKSEYLDWICERLSVLHDLKFAVFSPENYPISYHISKLAEKLIGKKFKNESGCINSFELDQSINFISDHFYFIRPDETPTIDFILNKIKQLVLRHGVNAVIIDPFNKIQKDLAGQTETQFIQELLNNLSLFKQKYGLHIFLVAHPTKMKKEQNSKKYDVPSLYDISGSSEFYNQADYGISVYRDFDQQRITIYIQKVKFKHLGKQGFIDTKYNINNGRFSVEDMVIQRWDNENHLETIEEIKPLEIQENINFEKIDDNAPF